MRSCAEAFFKYCADEGHIQVILAPDAVLMLFVDGSSITIIGEYMTIFESCWEETLSSKEPSFVDFYEA